MESAVTRGDEGVRYRDLNKNGCLDPYEDPRLPTRERVEDLLVRMTLEEKAGLLFHSMGRPSSGAGPLRGMPVAEERVVDQHITHFNLAGGGAARDLAVWHNELQAAAERTRLGLFDQPFVDPDGAEQVVGAARFRAAGAAAQRRSLVMLKNGPSDGGRTLPLRGRPKLYIERMHPEIVAAYGEVVSRPEEADYSVLRLQTPYEPRDGSFLEQFFHAGDLSLREPERTRLLDVIARAPAVVVISLDRPAVIPELAERSAALLADFGAADDAVLDVLFGRAAPEGKLPFELPSSMAAVRAQLPDVPHDSANPLFPFGYGLRY